MPNFLTKRAFKMESLQTALSLNAMDCIRECQLLLERDDAFDAIVVKLESFLFAITEVPNSQLPCWGDEVQSKLELVIELLVTFENSRNTVGISLTGRPLIPIPVSGLELLLSMKFKATDIAKLYGVSRHTIFRRLRAHGLSISMTYSTIADQELNAKIHEILITFPNTGYKRMKGFLLERGIRVTDARVREAMRQVDPLGVYQRTLSNRAIVRRQYCVSYFNQLWHLDTNMKLIRWNIVIRSCIDGKSRLVVYLHCSSDNTAETNVISFLQATASYGIPSRTRSDKGGENVLIAKFMLEKRGLGRGSHICGRSVHNQRIERYWRDVFYGYTGAIYNVFSSLEMDGYLDIDNPKHVYILHFVFLPRMTQSLEAFRNAWNSHPISTENNYSPMQLMVMSLPPQNQDLELNEAEMEDVRFICNGFDDLTQLMDDMNHTITTPQTPQNCLAEAEFDRIKGIDVLRNSANLGYDIYVEAVSLLNM